MWYGPLTASAFNIMNGVENKPLLKISNSLYSNNRMIRKCSFHMNALCIRLVCRFQLIFQISRKVTCGPIIGYAYFNMLLKQESKSRTLTEQYDILGCNLLTDDCL